MSRGGMHRNLYDGHTLGPIISGLEKLTGVAVHRIHGDYRDHNYPRPLQGLDLKSTEVAFQMITNAILP
jgi:hypothetical protein